VRKRLAVLGSTGSIGRQTLNVVEAHADHFEVYALAAHNEIKLLKKQIFKFKPQLAVVTNEEAAKKLAEDIKGFKFTKVIAGSSGLNEAVSDPQVDIAVIAVSGIAGLQPTLAAINARKRIALANKETLVVAGKIVMEQAKKKGALIIPVDSEHSAIFQCIHGENRHIKKIILTASGGPFRNFKPKDLKNVTPDMALSHPNWSMGKKITIDSATMMNKGLELIEARWLFDIPYDRIEIVIHPQSIIHSMVEYVDGSILAQLSLPDMKVPIQYALTWPERLPSTVSVNFTALEALTFEKPDERLFPCLKLARIAGEKGGIMPVVLNASNEVAVNLFLEEKITFLQIPHLVEAMMERFENIKNPSLETILKTDSEVRRRTIELAVSLTKNAALG